MRHKNRTVKGDQLKARHQATYEKWWLGKMIIANGVPKKVTKVEYIGNSVYGGVRLILDGSIEYYVPNYGSYRPVKSDVEVVE